MKGFRGLKETHEQIESKGKAMWIQADVSKQEDLDRMALETKNAFGKIDILVNNAAFIPSRKDFMDTPPLEFEQVLNTNVKGAWVSTRAVSPYMKDQGKGKIINIASETFFTGSHDFAHYVASKGGLVGLGRALVSELGSVNICVNVVAVGFVDTPGAAIVGDVKKYDTSRTPLGRFAVPQDIIGMVSFLASDGADFITGQTMVVDGGRFMH
jgi:3-oxoacyl-[acyl-carrier protein] reductase